MSVAAVVVAVLSLLLAVGWVSIGTLGLVGRLPRNRWVGVRSAETMRSPDHFALANRGAGPGIIGAGLIVAMGGLLALGIGGGVGLLFAVLGVVAGAVVAGVASGYAVRAVSVLGEPATDCGVGGGCGSCALQGACSPDGTAAAG
ncbi:SdpI family protein [Williamsia sterculiae]|uniref:SdpI family protein n=1 Tax=Williamsia sterculiae TaxID=1344003 RepID=UPI001F3C56FB|nr:SdpI family protein [Williamsia sterculiae]